MKKIGLGVVSLLLLSSFTGYLSLSHFIISTSAQSQGQVDPYAWSTYRGNAQRTGYNNGPAPSSNSTLWIANLDDALPQQFRQAGLSFKLVWVSIPTITVNGGSAFVALNGGYVYNGTTNQPDVRSKLLMLDINSGRVARTLWSSSYFIYPVGFGSRALIVFLVATGSIPSPSGSGPWLGPYVLGMLAFDSTGNLLWNRSFPGDSGTYPANFGILYQGKIIVEAQSESSVLLNAYDESTGSLVWSQAMSQPFIGQLVASKSYVVTPFAAYDVNTGKSVWQNKWQSLFRMATDDSIVASSLMPIAYNVTSVNTGIILRSGSVSQYASARVFQEPILIQGKTSYIINQYGRYPAIAPYALLSLDYSTGTYSGRLLNLPASYNYTTGESAVSNRLSLVGDTAVAAGGSEFWSDGWRIFSTDSGTGSTKWQYKLPLQDPSVATDSQATLAIGDGVLVAAVSYFYLPAAPDQGQRSVDPVLLSKNLNVPIRVYAFGTPAIATTTTTVSTSSSTSSTSASPQGSSTMPSTIGRTNIPFPLIDTFRADGLFWTFFMGNDTQHACNVILEISCISQPSYSTSPDGLHWSKPSNLTSYSVGSKPTRTISTWSDGIDFQYVSVGVNSTELRYRRGILTPTGVISWKAPEQVVATLSPPLEGIAKCATLSVATDSNEYSWIAYADCDTAGGVVVTHSTRSDGVWVTAPGFPKVFNDIQTCGCPGSPSPRFVDAVVLPVGSLGIVVLGGTTEFNQAGKPQQKMVAWSWTGSAWREPVATNETGALSYPVADGSYVHIIDGGDAVYSIDYSFSFNTFSKAVTIPETTLPRSPPPALIAFSETDVNNFRYLFWSDPRTNITYSKVFSSAAQSWSPETVLILPPSGSVSFHEKLYEELFSPYFVRDNLIGLMYAVETKQEVGSLTIDWIVLKFFPFSIAPSSTSLTTIQSKEIPVSEGVTAKFAYDGLDVYLALHLDRTIADKAKTSPWLIYGALNQLISDKQQVLDWAGSIPEVGQVFDFAKLTLALKNIYFTFVVWQQTFDPAKRSADGSLTVSFAYSAMTSELFQFPPSGQALDAGDSLLNKKSLITAVLSHANILVTSPDGKRIGTDPATGQAVQEMDGYYTGPYSDPQVAMVFNPVDGQYRVQVFPVATGTAHVVYLLGSNQTQSAASQTFELNVVSGQTQTSELNVSGNTLQASFPSASASPIQPSALPIVVEGVVAIVAVAGIAGFLYFRIIRKRKA